MNNSNVEVRRADQYRVPIVSQYTAKSKHYPTLYKQL